MSDRDGHGTVRDGEVEHLGDMRHFGVMEVITSALEHTLRRAATDVVLEHKPPRQHGTLLGGVSAVDHHEEGVCVSGITRYVNILSWGGGDKFSETE